MIRFEALSSLPRPQWRGFFAVYDLYEFVLAAVSSGAVNWNQKEAAVRGADIPMVVSMFPPV